MTAGKGNQTKDYVQRYGMVAVRALVVSGSSGGIGGGGGGGLGGRGEVECTR